MLFVRLILALVLLGCPYICLGQLTGGAVCADRNCPDACSALAAETAAQCSDCCRRDEADSPATLRHDRPADDPATPPSPTQCLCEGALAVAESRVTVIDVSEFVLSATDAGRDGVASSLRKHSRCIAETTTGWHDGREILVRDCALLI